MRLNHHLRTGSVYVALLGVATIVGVIGVSALTATRLQRRMSAGSDDSAQARLHARSAIDWGLILVEENPGWIAALGDAFAIQQVSVGTGHFNLEGSIPGGVSLGEAMCQPITFTGDGFQGEARRACQAMLQPDAVDFDPLSDAILDAGPITYWRLGESAGNVADDEQGRNKGRYRQGVTLGESVSNRCRTAAWFDGSNDLVEIPHSDEFLLDNGTVQFWFRPEALFGQPGLVSKNSGGFDTGGHMSIWLNGSSVYARLDSKWAGYYIYAAGAVAGQWNHVVFSFGAGGMRLYVNGTPRSGAIYTGGLGTTSGDIGNYEPIAFGVDLYMSDDESINGWTDPFRGQIADVAIYDRALTDEEITAIYDAGTAPAPTTVSIIPGSWRWIVD